MLGFLDWLLISIYLAIVIGVGIACRGKQESADDYFTAGGSFSGPIGSVLVGLSIAATVFSGISFLAIPSVTYEHGPALLAGLIAFPFAWFVLRYWFLPRYLSEKIQEPFGILQKRYGQATRQTAAIMFVLLRLGWMSALIYAPAIAIMGAAGLGDQWLWPVVLVIGLASTLYTVFGGIRGVIVTDAIQFLVIAASIILVIIYIFASLPVPMGEALGALEQQRKPLNFSFDFTEKLTIWAVIMGMIVGNLSSFTADQMSLQRYIASGSVRSASRSFVVNVIGVIVVLMLLISIGVSLAMWYTVQPDGALPASADKVMMYFVATELPVGIAGLLLAAILAATMSSMTSGINALACAVCQDIGGGWTKKLSDRQQVLMARWTSLIFGLMATVVAGMVDELGTIFTMSQKLLGVFLGPLMLGMFFAVFHVRIQGKWIILAMVGGCLCGWVVIFSPIYGLWVAPISFVTALVIACCPIAFDRTAGAFGLNRGVT
ncbi:sodium:solute symporter family transporter [Poriferisphaera sp. WC338]|uniref:sodium:solute symporter family transporter n=1 Tax=Poriferisphaera sp. WC338 TaxID=3425129 RepID=UPI003D816232